MADSIINHERPSKQLDPYQNNGPNTSYQEQLPVQFVPTSQAQSYISPSSSTTALNHTASENVPTSQAPVKTAQPVKTPKGDTPREIRNRAEKQRRDKLNQSIAELAAMVPPVVAASRKLDKTGILRLTAHYLRAHNYVFGDSINESQDFSPAATQTVMAILNGFLLTCTYKGLIVVLSENIQKYLGYTEVELLGHSVFTIIHPDDRQIMRNQLMPNPHLLGPNGELLIPDEPNGKEKVAKELAKEKRRFMVRFKKPTQRSEPCKYVTCHVEGFFRKSDRASQGYNPCYQVVRRGRSRGENPYSSGNDVVFVGLVRPVTDTFISQSNLEVFRMEYRTRHSIDGQIIQSEPRMSIITGYMTSEVNGVNAMNFMHRNDVRWVIIALREMYDQHRLVGESCYRLMLKNGQFIYMKTRGCLEVDEKTRAVTSFVCTNTVVDGLEGKHLIKQMKRRFTLLVNNNEELPLEEESSEVVEDPRQLAKVILHLVTDLPAKGVTQTTRNITSELENSPGLGLAIIPPKRDKIVSAIEKIYTVISTLPKDRADRLRDIQRKPLTGSNDNTVKAISSNPTIQTCSPAQSSGLPTVLPTYNHSYPQNSRNNNTTATMDSRKLAQIPTSGSDTVYNSSKFANFASCSKSTDPVQEFHPTTKVEYQCNLSDLEDDENDIQTENGDLQPRSASMGVKRSGNFREQNIAYKKKISEIPEEKTAVTTIEQEILSNDDFDNILFDMPPSQLENALSSLDQTVIDSNFPDFLNSPDDQDIITQIIKEMGDENPVTDT